MPVLVEDSVNSKHLCEVGRGGLECLINHQVGFLEGSNFGRSPEQEGATSSSRVSAVPQDRLVTTMPYLGDHVSP